MSSSEVSAARFVELLVRSGLVAAERVEGVLTKAGYPTVSSLNGGARLLADRLVSLGVLTPFQAAKLLHGRWVGLVMGPYRLLTPLGSGGMGQVYLAQDQRRLTGASVADKQTNTDYPWESLVALKVLPPRLARAEPRMIQRLEREERYYRRVSHPQLVRLEEAGEWKGIRYLALEFVPGRSLQELVARWGRLDPERAIRFFADVAAGLHHLHERQLVHRDIKPANIMVTPEGAAKILDLGLALARDEPLPEDIRIAGGKGYIVGTMDYIAPEQARDATAVDHRADLYALGCTMYFALAGTPPFPGGSKKDKIRWQRLVEPLPLRQLNPAVPVPLAELIHQLMAKRPQQRPSSAEAVRSQLLSFSSGSRTALSVPAISFQEAVATYRGGETTATDWWGESSEDTPVTRSNSHPQIILPPPPPTEPVMPAVPPHRLPPQLPLSWSILWLTFLLVGGVLLVMCVLLLIRSL